MVPKNMMSTECIGKKKHFMIMFMFAKLNLRYLKLLNNMKELTLYML